jgi:hypothetical protein
MFCSWLVVAEIEVPVSIPEYQIVLKLGKHRPAARAIVSILKQ